MHVQQGPLECIKGPLFSTVCLINDAAYYMYTDIDLEDLNKFCYPIS